jgi:ABC-type multidrug transport system fused ATPase/permease subunit
VAHNRPLEKFELKRANLRARRYHLTERLNAYRRLRTAFASAALCAALALTSLPFWYDGEPLGYYVLGALIVIFWLGALASWWRGRLKIREIHKEDRKLAKTDKAIIRVDDTTMDRLRLRELEDARDDLKLRIKSQLLLRNFLLVLVLVTVAGTGVMVFFYSGRGYIGLAVILLVLLGILQITRERARELEADRRQIDYEIAVISSASDLKAETLFLKQSFELKRYYDQALRQASLVFPLGAAALAIGAATIGGALWVITQGGTDEWLAASLGAVGAVASNLVAAVYLQMHQRSVELVAKFHQRLSRYQAGHFGNLLAFELGQGRDALIRYLALASVQLEEAAVEAESAQEGPEAGGPRDYGGRPRRPFRRIWSDARGRRGVPPPIVPLQRSRRGPGRAAAPPAPDRRGP